MDNDNIVESVRALVESEKDPSLEGLLSKILQHLRENRVMDNHTLYYLTGNLFRDKEHFNTCLERACTMLCLTRAELNILPEPQGRFAGYIQVQFRKIVDTGTGYATVLVADWHRACGVLNGAVHSVSTLIQSYWLSTPTKLIALETGPTVPQYIIVIEHRCMLEHLVRLGFPESSNSVLVTGGGYPDFCTRALVSKLSRLLPDAEVVCVVDWNPHGAQILFTYKFASDTSPLESRHIVVPKMKWLGIRRHHIAKFQVDAVGIAGAAGAFEAVHRRVFQPNDHTVARSLLRRIHQYTDEGHELDGYAAEIERMQEEEVKYEMQAIHEMDDAYLIAFLKDCLDRRDFI